MDGTAIPILANNRLHTHRQSRNLMLMTRHGWSASQTFSAGLSSEAGQGSGHWGSSGTLVMFTGTANRAEICQPAWSTSSTQCVGVENVRKLNAYGDLIDARAIELDNCRVGEALRVTPDEPSVSASTARYSQHYLCRGGSSPVRHSASLGR